MYWYSVEETHLSAHTLEASVIGVETVIRLKRDARSTGEQQRQEINEYAFPARPPPLSSELNKF